MQRLGNYILTADGEPAPCDSIIVWAIWFESSHDERRVAYDEIGANMVSTVFLGTDHRFFGDGPPILWETLVSTLDADSEIYRYASKAAALTGHAQQVARLRGRLMEATN